MDATDDKLIYRNEKKIRQACLATLFHWVHGEAELNSMFKKGSMEFVKNSDVYFKKWDKFVIAYSVHRKLKPKNSSQYSGSPKEKRRKVLNKLGDEYLDLIVDGKKIDVIRWIDSNHKEFTCESIRSLLSKMACLARPDKYPMWDSYVRLSLKENYGKCPSTYQDFVDLHTSWYESFQEDIKAEALDFINLMRDKFQVSKIDFSEEMFLNRAADKYLWLQGQNTA